MSILTESEKLRYHRHILLEEVGEIGQEKIKMAKILVVGAGGLGCPVIQYLTATGIGHLTIMDDEVVDISNLQRQVFYGINDLGKHKAIVATALMKAMNKSVDIEQIIARASYKNALELVANYDLVLDCTDNLQARYVLSDACVLNDKPLVHASVYKTQGQLSVFNYQQGPSYRCLFPKPEDENLEGGPTLGIYSVLPGIMGLMQVNEALKIILGIGEVLSGKMLVYDSINQRFNFLGIQKDPANFIAENILKNF